MDHTCYANISMEAENGYQVTAKDLLNIPYHGGEKLAWEVWQYEAVQPVDVPYPLMCCQSLKTGQSHSGLVLLEWTESPEGLEMQC